jgi:hypothetical protein
MERWKNGMVTFANATGDRWNNGKLEKKLFIKIKNRRKNKFI